VSEYFGFRCLASRVETPVWIDTDQYRNGRTWSTHGNSTPRDAWSAFEPLLREPRCPRRPLVAPGANALYAHVGADSNLHSPQRWRRNSPQGPLRCCAARCGWIDRRVRLTTNPFRSSSSPAGLADPTTRRTLLGLTSDDLRVAEEISVRYLSDLVASHSELVDATVVGTFPVFDEDTALPVGAMVRVSFPMPVPTVTLT